MPVSRKPVAVFNAGDLCLAPGERAIVPARWDRQVPEEACRCEESSLSGITVQAGICTGSSQEVMLSVINESELEYTLERGLPLAEVHEWIARPTPVLGKRVALSTEERRETAAAPSEAQLILPLAAAEASRITDIAITAFEPNPLINGAHRLDLAVIGLIPEDSISQVAPELTGFPHSKGLPSFSHPAPSLLAASWLKGWFGITIHAEAHRREALISHNNQLSIGAFQDVLVEFTLALNEDWSRPGGNRIA